MYAYYSVMGILRSVEEATRTISLITLRMVITFNTGIGLKQRLLEVEGILNEVIYHANGIEL